MKSLKLFSMIPSDRRAMPHCSDRMIRGVKACLVRTTVPHVHGLSNGLLTAAIAQTNVIRQMQAFSEKHP
jgi:hypothetical protein